VQAVQPRQRQVQQHQAGRVTPRQRHRLATVGRLGAGEALPLQQDPQAEPRGGVVLGDEHVDLGGGLGGRGGRRGGGRRRGGAPPAGGGGSAPRGGGGGATPPAEGSAGRVSATRLRRRGPGRGGRPRPARPGRRAC